MNEIWKPVYGYEGLYEVSNLGWVRSTPRKGTGGKVLKEGYIKGYACVSLSSASSTNTRLVHRLVAAHFIENDKSLPEVNHKDGNKLNNSASNLEWTDRDGNMVHARVTGLVDNRGDKHGMHKLDVQAVLSIKSAKNVSNKHLAVLWGISEQTVSDIKTGKTWKHLHDAGVKL